MGQEIFDDNSLERKESKPLHWSGFYHGRVIEVMEMEHRMATDIGNGESLERPKDWRRLLEEEIKSFDGDISPEYCTPELAIEGVYANKLVGKLAESVGDERGDQLNIFYDFLADCAGAEGKNLVAVDPADKALFMIYDMGLSVAAFELMKFAGMIQKNAVYTNKLSEIESWERWMVTSNDARHLTSARGLMEHTITSGRSILHINAPFHAERVVDYVERQVDEEADGVSIKKPIDVWFNSPLAEKVKMIIYGRLGLSLDVKTYEPVLRREAYRLNVELSETWANLDENVYTVSEFEDGLSVIEDKYREYLKSYLEVDVHGPEFKFCSRLMNSLEGINSLRLDIKDNFSLVDETKEKLKNIRKLGSTRKDWKRISKKPVY